MAVSLLDKLKFKINTNPPFKLKKSHKKKKKKSKTPSSPIASKKPTIAIPEAIPEKQLWEGSQDLLKQQASDHGNPSDNLAGTSILPTPTIPRVDLLGDLKATLKSHGLSFAAPTGDTNSAIHPAFRMEHKEPVFLGNNEEPHTSPGK
jgi:hypothetical protein